MLFFLNTSSVHATTPIEIILKTSTAKKPAVFPHAKHQVKNECDACHKDANFPALPGGQELGHKKRPRPLPMLPQGQKSGRG